MYFSLLSLKTLVQKNPSVSVMVEKKCWWNVMEPDLDFAYIGVNPLIYYSLSLKVVEYYNNLCWYLWESCTYVFKRLGPVSDKGSRGILEKFFEHEKTDVCSSMKSSVPSDCAQLHCKSLQTTMRSFWNQLQLNNQPLNRTAANWWLFKNREWFLYEL